MKTHIKITEEKIDANEAINFVFDPKCGAVASFIGAVRNNNFDRDVVAVSYDIFEPLALNILQKLCDCVREKFGELNIYLVHYKGYLKVGELSVAIAVSSKHRKEAFDGCRFLIEELKHKTPIWKKEFYTDGHSDWVEGHKLCSHK
jgi:molybdopterin synthase catalytic subunit